MPYKVLIAEEAEPILSSGLGDPLTNEGMTLAEMEQELDLQLTRRDDISPERRYLWINQSYFDLASSLDIDDLKGSLSFALLPTTDIYLLPPEVRATRGVSIIDSFTYGQLGGIPLHKTDLDAYRMLPDLSGEPREYFRERDMLVLWPSPEAARVVSVDFWIRPLPLVNLTDSPILPFEWHEAILLNARKKAFAAIQEFDKALVAENDFVQFVRRRTDRNEVEDNGRVVLSSVPRQRGQLKRRRLALHNPDLG